VVELAEVADQPHLRARQTFRDVDGVLQPAPAPRFSRTVPDQPPPPRVPGADTAAVLADWGVRPPPTAAG
jgi:alpha-methylacyl-CoA racemase